MKNIEYVNKELLIADLEERYCKPCGSEKKDYYHTKCRVCCVDDIIGEIDSEPAADVAPVMHGEWEYIGTDKMGNVFRCSNCANRIGLDKETDYCPNCGAKMDLEV